MDSFRKPDVVKSALVGAVVIAATFAGHVYAQSSMLTDKAGMTVYTFDRDTAGKSACYGGCANAWPPVPAANMPTGADVSKIVRDGGMEQATFKGKPLYSFAGDRKPGDMSGDKMQNVWHVVTPDSQAKTSARQPAYSAGSPYGY